MAQSPQSIVRRRLMFLLAAVVLLLVAIGVFGYASVNFLRRAFPRIALPQKVFDEGQRVVIETPEPDTRYYLAVVVEAVEDPLPVVDVTITSPGGDAIETEPLQGYSRIFGHRYRHFLVLKPADHGTFEVYAAPTEPAPDGATVDFALFYDVGQVLPQEIDAAVPGWLTSGIIGLTSLGCLCVAVFWRGKNPYLTALAEDRAI